MDKEEVLASTAVIVLAGVIFYLTKVGFLTINGVANRSNKITANQAIATAEINAAGGNIGSLLSGPSIYMANTPWPFGPNVGNVIPPNSAGVTLPGASEADFLGFNAA